MIENITHKKKILAIIIRSTYRKKKGINFFTKKNLIQQVAYMNHAKNHLIHPHTHKKIVRKISGTSEVLIILNGKLRVDFYSQKKNFVKSKVINKNDILILLNGGHGFKMIKNCKFIEIKQGPFVLNKDKNRF
tara:strand:+ start:97 stop:495 length:399 start_codon:yes stop_codon:yes gene_type:complete